MHCALFLCWSRIADRTLASSLFRRFAPYEGAVPYGFARFSLVGRGCAMLCRAVACCRPVVAKGLCFRREPASPKAKQMKFPRWLNTIDLLRKLPKTSGERVHPEQRCTPALRLVRYSITLQTALGTQQA